MTDFTRDLKLNEKREPFSNTVKISSYYDVSEYNILSQIIIWIYYIWWGIIFLAIWIVAGISAFFASIACLFYDSSLGDKIAGLLIAMLFGPFYWFFYIYKSTYCNSYPAYMPVVNYYD